MQLSVLLLPCLTFLPSCLRQVKKQMLDELTRVAKETRLKGFELIKAVYIESEPFRWPCSAMACESVPVQMESGCMQESLQES